MLDPQQQLEGGAYEVIRGRLEKWGGVLQDRLTALNVEREEVFGAVSTALLSTERVATEHNCTPRDLVAIGKNRFIFGYNIQFGLKSTTDLEDVFAVYDFDPATREFSAVPLGEVLGDSAFTEDFQYLYKYYRETVFVKFMRIGPHLYMAMRIGKEITDIKTFKWLRKGNGKLEYIGNRFDHEYQFPPQHEFEWKRAHRDMQRAGEHPHISIEDRVFVETVGGDLTIKIEDNTSSGEGIYQEDVTERDQTLDDAEILYAIVGPLILLKILPYRETLHRYLVYNEKTKSVHRIDAIGQSCVLLPDDHGLIFSNGYLLLTGEAKIFETALADMRFERRIASANGEDTLFVFYNRKSGDYILLSYNLITQTVDTPVYCHGYSLFPDGLMIYFRSDEEAQKYHALQIWQTPILSEEVALDQKSSTDSFLAKIGNAELVRGMAECREIQSLLRKDDSYGGLYLDLTKKTGDMLDSYFWLAKEEAKNLAEPLRELKTAANAAIDEFEKVRALRASTAAQSKAAEGAVADLLKAVRIAPADDIFAFVKQLGDLRKRRGEVIGLRELRYISEELVAGLEATLQKATAEVSEKTVKFLLSEEALDPYRKKVEAQAEVVPKLAKVTEADAVGEALDNAGAELEMLIEVVGNLKIEDATETTQIIDSVSGIYSTLNGVRAELKNKRKDLARGEGEAQFGAQIKLLSQTVVNYLDLCDTPAKAEEYLSKVMVQLEEMEGKFAEFDEYVDELTTKREEIYEAFEGRKQNLLEKKNRRASALQKSADRVLSGVKNRLETFSEINDINGYFAGDLMIEKVRDVITELTELGDSVKAGDIQTKLKTLRDDAVRSLKDRKELFVDGKEVLRFGRHQFAVNTQTLALSMVPREGRMCFHLSGTDFFEPIRDEAFLATKQVWSQEVVSENDEVYRAEWLAYQLLKSPDFMARWPEVDLVEEVRKFMQSRYAEGYVKGVHDGDAEKILEKLVPLQAEAGLLKFGPGTRAATLLFWESWTGEEKERLKSRLEAHAERRKIFGAGGQTRLLAELESAMGGKKAEAAYLFAELTDGEGFVVSSEAAQMVKNFRQELTAKQAEKKFAAALERFSSSLSGRLEVARDWMEATLTGELSLREDYLKEAAFWIARGGYEERWVSNLSLQTKVTGLKGSHCRIESGEMALHFNEFLERLGRFETEQVPVFRAYQKQKVDLIETKKEAMRLSEFEPKVMSSFVRNRLINEVYLPLIGDNLAKQMGTAGNDTRTDRMGLLLLISPPGYGKTTIMEYVGNRLGLTFMKINGPALGHEVTSLDPKQAPNASAAEEVEKLNLALEMGDNVMIYLDDIQHTNPEFLQKFISLCDGQRKIEGVYQGKAKTYDLRGKKVAVVMAGNPYTESGGKFQIPDMLANRADTYNLGDILGGHEEAFKASYIENCLTSSPALTKLASRSQKDVYAVMEMAKTGSLEGIDFEGNYTPAEVEEMRKTMVHLYRVRDTILRVNLQYIKSAAQEDHYRTEPAFRLQGSYRNMNRIAEKVLPLMTAAEVEQLIFSHYENESQTLTTGAEANLLKFKEMEKALSEEEAARWEAIKKEFNKRKLLGGAGENDPVARVVAQLSQFNDSLEGIGRGLTENSGKLSAHTVSQLEKIIASLRAVPVEITVSIDKEEGEIDIRKIERKEVKE